MQHAAMQEWAGASISNSEDGAPDCGLVLATVVCNLALANTSQMQVDDLVASATAEDHSPTLVEDSTHTSRAIARG